MAAPMGSSEYIDWRIEDGVAEVALNRPAVLNAFTPAMLDDLNVTLQAAMDDDAVRVVVLTGRGRGFCSGADIAGMEGRDDRSHKHLYGAHLSKVQNVIRLLYDGPTPTIAAINGPAVGAGADFALACDLRVMGEEAFLRQQFVNIGLAPADGGGWLLPRLIGESRAKYYFLLGEDITPTDAEDDGLVVDVVPTEEVLPRAHELAGELTAKPPLGVRNTKRLIDVGQSFETYARRAVDRQWECINDPAHYEAVDRLLEG